MFVPQSGTNISDKIDSSQYSIHIEGDYMLKTFEAIYEDGKVTFPYDKPDIKKV